MSKVIATTGGLFGGGDALAPFTSFYGNVDAKVDRIMKEGADDIRDIAQREVRENAYDTGKMHDNISTYRMGVMAYQVMCLIYYAIYVHEGTIHMAGRPFFDWAMDEHGHKTEDRLMMLLMWGQ